MRAVLEERFDRHRALLAGGFGAAAIALTSVMTGGLIANPSFVRLAFTAALWTLAVGIGVRAPRAVLYGMIGWLAALGLTRRLLSSGFSGPVTADPLLLVEPFALIILLGLSIEAGAFRIRTRLGNAMLVFGVLFVFGALNPLQGSLFAGVSALIFFIPLLAFWIGRTLPDATVKRALIVFAVCAVPAALYGLFQISNGFPSWDQAWIDSSGYTALQVGDAIRPFSSFSSASEYATFLAAAMIVWFVLVRRALRPLSLAALVLLGTSVFYQSSRGAVVALCVAFALIIGARRGLALWASVAVGAALLAMVPYTVRHLAPQNFGQDNKSQLVAHQVQGLSNPFDAKQSTATAHISLTIGGIRAGFRDPLGSGISAVTIAGAKFGGNAAGGAEADPANVAIALGLPGLLVYLVVFGLGITRAYSLARRTREPLALATLGILLVVFPQWLNGGQYAVAFLPWLVLGWVDGASARAAAAATQREREGEKEEQPEPKALPRLRLAGPPRSFFEPQRWELWRLERLARRDAGANPERDEARRYLLTALRPYATLDERLPPEFDGLVREEFGSLLESPVVTT
jgi:hypothetical protein